MMPTLAVVISVATGWLLVDMLLRQYSGRPRWAARLITVAFGAGVGGGLSSILYFLMRLAGVAGTGLLIAADVVLLLGAAAAWSLFQKPALPEQAGDQPRFGWNNALAVLLALGFLLVVLGFVNSAETLPHGDWDAWSTWNVRAKFLAAEGDDWRNAWSPLLSKTHPGYPLLVPSLVAHVWRYGGSGTPPVVPAALAFLFFAGTFAVLVSGTMLLRRTSLGLLAGLVLLATSGFLAQGPSQYADVPLSFYILGTLVLMGLARQAPERASGVLALAGLMAGLASWTKNEGLLFLGCCVVGLGFIEFRSRGVRTAARSLAWFLSGSLPGLFVTVLFKLALAPDVNPLAKQSLPEVLGRLSEADRYLTIARAWISELMMLGDLWTHPVLLLAVLVITLRFIPAPARVRYPTASAVALSLLIAGYLLVYLTTPLGLEWHLSTSLGRLYAQIWPSAILLIVTALRAPEDFAIIEQVRSKKELGTHGKRRR